jgi:hypothetical protein
VPKTGKRVFQEKVLPNSGHPTEGFHRNRCIDVPKTGKRVFQEKVLPNSGHGRVVPFFKLATFVVIVQTSAKNKKLKAFENDFNLFQCF